MKGWWVMYRMTIGNCSDSLKKSIVLALNQNVSEACRRIWNIAMNSFQKIDIISNYFLTAGQTFSYIFYIALIRVC
jgi:hypothetical protein